MNMEKQQDLEGNLWDQTGGTPEGYFKPEANTAYHLYFEFAEIRHSEKYRYDSGKPKLELHLKIRQLNGQPCNKIFTTGSFTVINEVKKFVRNGKAKIENERFQKIEFFLKRIQDGNKIQYLFSVSREPEQSDLGAI